MGITSRLILELVAWCWRGCWFNYGKSNCFSLSSNSFICYLADIFNILTLLSDINYVRDLWGFCRTVCIFSKSLALPSWFCYLAGRNSYFNGAGGIALVLSGGHLSIRLRIGDFRLYFNYFGLILLYCRSFSRCSLTSTYFFFSFKYLFSALSRYSRALRSYRLSLRFFGPPFFCSSPFFTKDNFFSKTCFFII
jgi:hypothetical protein